MQSSLAVVVDCVTYGPNVEETRDHDEQRVELIVRACMKHNQCPAMSLYDLFAGPGQFRGGGCVIPGGVCIGVPSVPYSRLA